VLGRENLPLTYAIWRRATSNPSPYHPSPKDNARYFMDGVSASVEEMTVMKLPRQMNRRREQHNRIVERLQERRLRDPSAPSTSAPIPPQNASLGCFAQEKGTRPIFDPPTSPPTLAKSQRQPVVARGS
jgi:hypothetical protein